MRYEVNPKIYRPETQCFGKLRFKTIEEAYAVFEHNTKKYGPPDGDIVLYCCPHCGDFHYGRDLEARR